MNKKIFCKIQTSQEVRHSTWKIKPFYRQVQRSTYNGKQAQTEEEKEKL